MRIGADHHEVASTIHQISVVGPPVSRHLERYNPRCMDQLFEFIVNRWYLVGGFLIVLFLFVRNEVARGGRAVTPQELVNLVNRDRAVVLDVRDAKDYSQGHIVDAVNVPHTSLATRLAELEKYKSRPIVVACKMGQHAGAAGTILRKSGFDNVSRLKGGITEWLNQNLPTVRG